MNLQTIKEKVNKIEALTKEECRILADHLLTSTNDDETIQIYQDIQKCSLSILRINPMIGTHVVKLINSKNLPIEIRIKEKYNMNMVPGEKYLTIDTVLLNFGDCEQGNNGWLPVPKDQVLVCVKSETTIPSWDKEDENNSFEGNEDLTEQWKNAIREQKKQKTYFCVVKYMNQEFYLENCERHHKALTLI